VKQNQQVLNNLNNSGMEKNKMLSFGKKISEKYE